MGDPRIRFLGYADEWSLPDLYRQADVLVVPSLFEPWGLVLQEGLAYGLPVIATDQVAAADDLINSGVNGYVVPAGSDEALASAMRSVAEWSPSHRREAAARTGGFRRTGSTERRTRSSEVACSVFGTVAR